MRACFAQKLLPLALCFAAGVAAWGAAALADSSDAEARRRAEADGPAASRARLVIHSRPKPVFAEAGRASDGPPSVKLRAKLGADGTISEIVPLFSRGMSDTSVAEAVSATRRITFTPPTEDGIPRSVVAEIVYELGGSFVLGAGACVFTPYPTEPSVPSVNIISVEGAIDPGGWRVTYE